MAAANAVHKFRLVMSAGSPSAVEEPLKTEPGPSRQPRIRRAAGSPSGRTRLRSSQRAVVVRPGDDRFPYGGPRLALDQGRRPLLFLVIFSFTLMNLPIRCMTERHWRQGASGRALTRLPSPKLNGDGHSQPHAVRPELLWRGPAFAERP